MNTTGLGRPEQDKKLQAGLDKDADEKQRSIAGIIKNEEQFNKIKMLFAPQDWEADSPFCHGLIELNNIKFRVMFRMNEAAMSKLNLPLFTTTLPKTGIMK